MNGSRVCIHIGLHKTATTTLQNQFFSRHSEIEYLGKYNLAKYQISPAFRDAQTTSLFEQIQETRLNAKQMDLLKQLFNRQILPKLDSNKLLVVSAEGFSSGDLWNRRRRAENFKAIFGSCKIVIMLREPLALIQSYYFQVLKEVNLQKQPITVKQPDYYSIEQWLERHWNSSLTGPLWILDYYQTIKTYCETFGQENVGIFLFEQLKHDPTTFKHNICSFAGIKVDKTIEITPDRKDNERWNEAQIDKLREIRGSLFQSLKYRFFSTTQKEDALGLTQTNSLTNNGKATAKIPDQWKMRIQEYTRPGNRIIRNRWGLPLDKWNYPT